MKLKKLLSLTLLSTLVLTASVLSNLYANTKSTCGQNGTLEERIADCNWSTYNSVLVKRELINYDDMTDVPVEFHMDVRTGKIWTDIFWYMLPLADAERFCNQLDVIPGFYASSLPRKSDIIDAFNRGFLYSNSSFLFWTGTTTTDGKGFAYDESTGEVIEGPTFFEFFFRCMTSRK